MPKGRFRETPDYANRRRVLTPAPDCTARIIELYNTRMGVHKIGELLGISSYRVLAVLSDEGVPRRGRGGGNPSDKKPGKLRFHESGLVTCMDCRQQKDPDDFVRHRMKDGSVHYVYCKPCQRKRRTLTDIKTKYKISEQEYEQLNAAQGGQCAICGNPETAKRKTRLAIDHCHQTGKVRALLCSYCNQGIGHFFEDVARLQAAIDYLNSHALKLNSASISCQVEQ